MYRETESRIGVRIGVALWRNAYPAIQRELCKDSSVREILDDIYQSTSSSSSQSVEDIRAKQAGHSRQMEEMIYGLLVTASPFATTAEQQQFRSVSIDWHHMLHFASSWEHHRPNMRVQKRIKAENEEARVQQQQRRNDIDIQAILHRLYGDHAAFRGVQEAALQAIVAGVPRMLVIMRTGGGKSVLFILPPAGCKTGVTIVVVPTISLRQYLQERCDRAHIACAEWDGRRPSYHARIVLVTPESAVSLAFGRFIDEKRSTHQLERIVIDECHTILESTSEWRPKVLQLCEMAEKSVQVLYLTATLQPSEEPQFYDAIGVPETRVVQFREPTSRPNVAYCIIHYRRDNEDEEVQSLVEEMKEQHRTSGQIIVFCKKVAQAKRLAEALQCSVYYRNVGNSDKKKSILRRLTGQTERVFTATNALGLGVDASSIRAVIHVGIREKLKQYAQESGWAGRDGAASEAIIMRATCMGRNGG